MQSFDKRTNVIFYFVEDKMLSLMRRERKHFSQSDNEKLLFPGKENSVMQKLFASFPFEKQKTICIKGRTFYSFSLETYVDVQCFASLSNMRKMRNINISAFFHTGRCAICIILTFLSTNFSAVFALA